jgi:hypothetical protein
MQKTSIVCWLALSVGTFFYGLHGAAAEVSADVREACTPDAMRLCSEFIPDADKVKFCMLRRVSQLSPACRAAMGRSHGRYAHRPYRRHYYRHRYYHHSS